MKKTIFSLATAVALLGSTLAAPAYATQINVKQQADSFHLQEFQNLTETEPNNTMAQANVVNSQEIFYTGTISKTDIDFYKITLKAKSDIGYLGYILDGSNSAVIPTLYDANGDVIDNGMSEEAYFTNDPETTLEVPAGTYYLKLEVPASFAGTQEYEFSFNIYEHIRRYSGNDRYETAVEIAHNWGGVDKIILATGQDFPDALAAGPLAYQEDAPILLTRKDKLPESVIDYIENIGVGEVTLIGGTSAISQSVENELKTLGMTVERIAGDTRFQTAALIADRLVDVDGEKEAYVVNGRNFPDALSISPVASIQGAPILLTEANTLPTVTAQKVGNYNEVVVIGGEQAVSNNVVNQLPSASRISGQTRYETSVKIAQTFSPDLFEYSTDAFIATGTSFADALAGAPMAAAYFAPLILTPSTNLHPTALTYLQAASFNYYHIIGGPSAVSENVVSELNSILK